MKIVFKCSRSCPYPDYGENSPSEDNVPCRCGATKWAVWPKKEVK